MFSVVISGPYLPCGRSISRCGVIRFASQRSLWRCRALRGCTAPPGVTADLYRVLGEFSSRSYAPFQPPKFMLPLHCSCGNGTKCLTELMLSGAIISLPRKQTPPFVTGIRRSDAVYGGNPPICIGQLAYTREGSPFFSPFPGPDLACVVPLMCGRDLRACLRNAVASAMGRIPPHLPLWSWSLRESLRHLAGKFSDALSLPSSYRDLGSFL